MTAAALRTVASSVAARVLIVDDSAVARAVMARVVDASGRYVVAGVAGHVAGALEVLGRTSVDYILLDIAMPGIDGLTALPNLIAAGGRARVLIVSSMAAQGAAITVRALALGAADTLAKPPTGSLAGGFAQALVDKLDRLQESVAPSPAIGVASRLPAPRQIGNAFDLIAIGASTGGIHALSQLLREIPGTMRLPILVTQHLPATFMPYFAAQVGLIANRPCEVATDLMRVRPGRVIVAPGDAHINCVALANGTACIRLSNEPMPSGCTPSVDPMLRSAAAVFGSRVLGVILSGMGRDGLGGARALQDAGGLVVAQDRASSVVWGMPGAIAKGGIAEALLPPDAIGRLIAEGHRP